MRNDQTATATSRSVGRGPDRRARPIASAVTSTARPMTRSANSEPSAVSPKRWPTTKAARPRTAPATVTATTTVTGCTSTDRAPIQMPATVATRSVTPSSRVEKPAMVPGTVERSQATTTMVAPSARIDRE